jgi:hypothetical protein
MSSVNAPYGLIPVNHSSGNARARAYTIASTYGTSIYKGDLVVAVDGGGIQQAAAGNTCLGVFAGVEYTDANGKPNYSPYWPGGTTATNIIAYVWDDPMTVFRVQGTALAAADVGEHADITVAAGSTATGISGNYVAAVSGDAAATLRIIGLYNTPDNAWADAYVHVLVTINEHQYSASVASV